jgi:hypothetical protein
MDENIFTSDDQKRFQTLKEQLRSKLRGLKYDSMTILECALHFVEIRDRNYQQMDAGTIECEEWMRTEFGVRRRQADKYFRVGTQLRAEDCAGKRQGIEVMDQIALAPPALRGTLWMLAEEEGLSDGALAAGRLAAQPLLRKSELRALKVLLRRARQRAEELDQEKAEKKKSAPSTPFERIERGLYLVAERLENFLDKGAELDDSQVKVLRLHLSRMAALDERLQSWQTRTAKTEKEEENHDVAKQDLFHSALNVGEAVADLLPLAGSVKQGLSSEDQERLSECLFGLVRGSGGEQAAEELQKVKARCQEAGHPPEPDLFSRLERGLCDHDDDRRRHFALHFVVTAGLPGTGLRLHLLKRQPLPPPLRSTVEALCQKVPMFP